MLFIEMRVLWYLLLFLAVFFCLKIIFKKEILFLDKWNELTKKFTLTNVYRSTTELFYANFLKTFLNIWQLNKIQVKISRKFRKYFFRQLTNTCRSTYTNRFFFLKPKTAKVNAVLKQRWCTHYTITNYPNILYTEHEKKRSKLNFLG